MNATERARQIDSQEFAAECQRALTRERNLGRFNVSHLDQQSIVVCVPILAEVNSPMAGWAERNNESRIVGPSIPQTTNVMWFKVGCTVRCKEWRWLLAAFAIPLGPSNYIVSDTTASLNHIDSSLRPGGIAFCSFECRGPHSGNVCIDIYRKYLYRSLNGFQRAKLKNYCLSGIAIAIRSIFEMVCREHHIAFETIAFFQLSEQKKIAAIVQVITNSEIPANKLHVSDLPFSEVLEDTIGPQSIRIAMRQSFLASDDDNDAMSSRRNNAALLLSSEPPVNVLAAIINAPAFEAPTHTNPSLFSWIISRVWTLVYRAGVVSNLPAFEGTGGGSTLQETPNLTFSEKA